MGTNSSDPLSNTVVLPTPNILERHAGKWLALAFIIPLFLNIGINACAATELYKHSFLLGARIFSSTIFILFVVFAIVGFVQRKRRKAQEEGKRVIHI